MIKFPGSLHGHTDHSNLRLRDSTNTVQGLIDRAIELGHEVVGITEHDTIASAIKAEEYYEKIKENNPNFKLVRGNEIYLVRDGLNAENFERGKDRYYHFILLAKDARGHEQIREISTRAWMRSYMSWGMRRVPTYYSDLLEVIGEDKGHVIGSTACLGGALPTQLLRNRETGNPKMESIEFWIEFIQDIFGKENFFFEMQPSYNEEQIYVNQKIVELSKKFSIPYIITCDAHYLRKEDRLIHKAFLNSQNGEREVDDFYASTYLMSDEEIHEYMEESLGKEVLQEAFKNIIKIKDMCEDYSLKKDLKIPRLNWKFFETKEDEVKKYAQLIPNLQKFLDSEYKEDKHLAYAIVDRVVKEPTLQNETTYNEIGACLDDTWISSEVNGSRWSAYFLNLQNIIDSCWDAGTLVGCGRGSGVGFILLYILGITQINPLREKSQTKRWRFLNPERVSVLDVDIDIEGSRRQEVLGKFRELYGEDRVANVLTLRTEKSKSAILTAARGLGIDVDEAQYIASMIQADRGQLRTLHQTYYGDKENGFGANQQFRSEMNANPELWQVAQGIEGLINGMGVHAGGVIFVDEPFTKTTALMRAPNGDIITQFELHDSEKVSNIKYDILSVEALDKIHNCLDLICEYGYEEKEPTLKETYEKIIGVYNLERDNPEMWEMCWNHEVNSLFQMEKQSGIQGIAAMKPTSVDDLAILNSAIRLMATERGGEQPLNKLARFKAHPNDWDIELGKYGLGEKEKAILQPILDISYGLCIAQEQFMELVQIPELGGFNLTWADKLRKSIAKKNPAEYEALTEEYFKVVKEKGLNENLCRYVWNVLIAMSRGYGFNLSHTLAYSIIGLQELNLAFRYPIILWNCACLISDSGMSSAEDWEKMKSSDEIEIGSPSYGKIASSIGKFKSEGIDIEPPNINLSSYTFAPDIDNNSITYGLGGITRIGGDLIFNIIENRPYESIEDFLKKVKVNKVQMVNLIKSGAFDRLYGEDRLKVMNQYIDLIYDGKKRLTLQNMKMLIDYQLIPEEYEYQIKVYNFNKYLKSLYKEYKKLNGESAYYYLDETATKFYNENYDIDDLEPFNEKYFKLEQTKWDKVYKKEMDVVRNFIKKNEKELLEKLNGQLRAEVWNKYCLGSFSDWEMESISCYIHPHVLEKVNNQIYGFDNFFSLSDEPDIEYKFTPKNGGKQIPIYRIHRIIGTVLDRDKLKRTVTLLTLNGVVTFKIFGDAFTYYDKQISEKDENGIKHVIEKSQFSRGKKIIATGIKRDDMFLAKKYKRTPYHLVEEIVKINDDGTIATRHRELI